MWIFSHLCEYFNICGNILDDLWEQLIILIFVWIFLTICMNIFKFVRIFLLLWVHFGRSVAIFSRLWRYFNICGDILHDLWNIFMFVGIFWKVINISAICDIKRIKGYFMQSARITYVVTRFETNLGEM